MKQKFPGLDAIRGVAALFVLIRHSESFWTFTLFRSYLAVDLFFLLSGFVIAHSYEGLIRSNRMKAGEFILVRWIRLYPMYAFSLLIAIALNDDWQSPRRVAKAILMVPSFGTGNGNLFPLDVTYWSLFFEIAINVGYACSFKWLSGRVLGSVVALCTVALAATAIQHGGINLGWAGVAFHFYPGLGRAVFGIAFGILLYRHRAAIALRLPASFGPAVAIAAISAVLCPPSASFHKLDAIIDMAAIAVVFPLCVVSAARYPVMRGRKVAEWLGAASYPLYLLHPLAYEICLRLAPDAFARHAPFSGLAFMAVMIGASIALERWADIPVRKQLSRWIFKRGAPAGHRRSTEERRDSA